MIHILISSVLRRIWEISDKYCVILVIRYYRPLDCSSSALKPSGFTVREARYCNFTTSIYVSLNSLIIYSSGQGWRKRCKRESIMK